MMAEKRIKSQKNNWNVICYPQQGMVSFFLGGEGGEKKVVGGGKDLHCSV